MSKIRFNFVNYFRHLTPLGSPLLLTPLLKVIELISNLIRFVTLRLRLTIKISTGHILLTLVRVGCSSLWMGGRFKGFFVVVFICRGYLLFELGVGFVQSFVFSLLVAQYTGEHRLI